MIITFFGHARFYKTEEYEQKILDLLNDIVGDASADFYFGGYGNFDSFAYDCCKKYKNTNPNTSLVFVTPYITIQYQNNYLKHIKNLYDDIIYPEIENKPLKYAIYYRNLWMVEKADYILCNISHEWGGAYKAYKYAKQKKKPIYNLTDFNI